MLNNPKPVTISTPITLPLTLLGLVEMYLGYWEVEDEY